MHKLLILIKQHWAIAAILLVLGSAGIAALPNRAILGDADGSKVGTKKEPSLNDMLRKEFGNKEQKSPISKPNRPQQSPDKVALDPNHVGEVPSGIPNEPLLDPIDPNECARHTSGADVPYPIIDGEVRSVGYNMDNGGQVSETDLQCTLQIYSKGCENPTEVHVYAAQDRTSKFGHFPTLVCESAERAMHDHLIVHVTGVRREVYRNPRIQMLHFSVTSRRFN